MEQEQNRLLSDIQDSGAERKGRSAVYTMSAKKSSAVKAVSAEVPASADAPKAKAPRKKAEAAEAPSPKAKSASKKAVVAAVESTPAPEAKTSKKKTEAPAVESAPAPKAKASTKKAEAVADAPKAKASSKKKPEAAASVVEAPKAKSSKKKAEASEPIAEAPKAKSSKKKAEASEPVAEAPKAKSSKKKSEASEPIAEAPKAKSSKKKSEAAPVQEAPAAKEETSIPKISKSSLESAKPRRRVLKRMGMLKQQENKKEQRHEEQRREAEKPKPMTKEERDRERLREKRKAKKDQRKEDKRNPNKEVPEAFGTFKKVIKPKTELKNERRMERMMKEERVEAESQGVFEEPIRLNRFVSLSGVCSRRDADVLIGDGKVRVNGKVVKEMGYKVRPGKDVVTYEDRELKIKVFVYLLMNKPKNKITTTDDELGRDTVMELAQRYTKARVYPVGRLDRNTTGLLLLTNDGDLTQKLTHPSSKVAKIYHVRADRDVEEKDILALRKGFELEDGFIKADKVDFIDGAPANEIGIQIHSGANHIVKRMMAHLGYEVVALDRVQFGPLNKRGLRRGTCRLLSDKEIGFLKML